MTKFDISKAILPVLDQLARNEGATVALAKNLLSEEKFKLFLLEQEIQYVHTWISLTEKFDSIFDDNELVRKNLDDKLKSLLLERDDA